MSYWFRAQPRLAAITPRRPGLFELLLTRTFLVSIFSSLFHLGMVVSLLSGIVMETMYLAGWSGVLGAWGWTITWTHGLFGLVMAIGLGGVLVRFAVNRAFRQAAGQFFYVEAAFLVVITVSGLVLLAHVLGLTATRSSWWFTVHLVSVLTWLVLSLFGRGLVAHGLATVVYRFTRPRSAASFRAFNTACVGCGKCLEVCPLYEASNGESSQAPALKVRRYLRAYQAGTSAQERKALAEEVYNCALCGLCMAVCPYSFPHYDLYMAVLKQANAQASKGAERA